MRIKLLVMVLVLMSKAFFAPAQIPVPFTLEFHPVFGNTLLNFDDAWFKLNESDSIKPEVLKFYISGIELLNGEVSVWKEDKYYLLDASDKASFKRNIFISPGITFNKIKFNLGVDSITSVSGAMGGDLDPARGMYWTWQSGYINFKLEGKSNKCKSRNNEFQYHLGGYQFPNNALRSINLTIDQKSPVIIVLDIAKLISVTDLENQHHIMSPGKPAMELSDQLVKAFSTQ